jgi:polar amino acid transport system substrate-binding protein
MATDFNRMLRQLAPFFACAAMACSGGALAQSSSDPVVIDAAMKAKAIVAGISTDPSVRAKLPADVLQRGKLIVAIGSSTQPPSNFFTPDGKPFAGWNIELAWAFGKVMGLEIELLPSNFSNLIPGLQSGRQDAVFAELNVTAERQAVVDMLSYFNTATGILRQKANPHKIAGPADLCGRKVGAITGSSSYKVVEAQSEQCKSQGKLAIQLTATPDASTGTLALQSGRVDAQVGDSTYLGYVAASAKEAFDMAPEPFRRVTQGIALPKNSPLAPGFQAALNSLIASGAYTKILSTWGNQGGGVTTAILNPL